MSSVIQVRFVDHDRTIEAAVGDSILELAERHEIDLDHACGGVCACSTCHIKVLTGAECFNTASDEEEDQLDTARDLDLKSRLGCQARIERAPSPSTPIEIAIPTWNINLAQES